MIAQLSHLFGTRGQPSGWLAEPPDCRRNALDDRQRRGQGRKANSKYSAAGVSAASNGSQHHWPSPACDQRGHLGEVRAINLEPNLSPMKPMELVCPPRPRRV
jgi:hypothetical protein